MRSKKNEMFDLILKSKWASYARPRFSLGQRRERQAWNDFSFHTQELYKELLRRARASKQSLEYQIEDLQIAILDALDKACPHCCRSFGLDSWGVSYVYAIERGGVGLHRLANLITTCARCAVLRGSIRQDIWMNMLYQFNAEDDYIAENYLNTWYQLWLNGAVRGKLPRVLPGPAVPRVTRESRRLRMINL